MAAAAKQIHDLEDSALVEHIQTVRQDLFGLRFQHATGELENTARLGALKRELARSLTIARQRGIDLHDTRTGS